MKRIVLGTSILWLTLINIQIYGASDQTIYWKLGELQKDVVEITKVVRTSLKVPRCYEQAIIPLGRFTPSVVPKDCRVSFHIDRARLAAITIGDYALFAGGYDNILADKNEVDILRLDRNSGAIRRIKQDGEAITQGADTLSGLALSIGRYDLSAAAIDNCVLFAGGTNSDKPNGSEVRTTSYNNTIDIFRFEPDGAISHINAAGDLIPSDATDEESVSGITLTEARTRQAAVSIGRYAIFAGGSDESSCYDTINIFTLTDGKIIPVKADGSAIAADATGAAKSSGLALSVARAALAVTTIGDYIIFAGGTTDGTAYTDAVDIFKLHKGKIIKIDADGDEIEVVTAQDGTKTEYKKTRQKLTEQRVEAKMITLSSARGDLAATTIGNFAIFAGGSGDSQAVDIFQLAKGQIVKVSSTLRLAHGRANLSATSIGDYALFAGGSGYLPSIEMFGLGIGKKTIIKVDADGDEIEIEDGTEYKKGQTTTKNAKIEAKELKLAPGRLELAATSIDEYAIFAGGMTSGNMSTGSVNIFCLNKTQIVPFNGLTSKMHITTEIVVDEGDEALAELQLREFEKISHINPGQDVLILRYFNDYPVIPLDIRVTVWSQ